MSVIYLKGSGKSPQFRQKPCGLSLNHREGPLSPIQSPGFGPDAIDARKKQGLDLLEASSSG
jgi:hypothetical protein